MLQTLDSWQFIWINQLNKGQSNLKCIFLFDAKKYFL